MAATRITMSIVIRALEFGSRVFLFMGLICVRPGAWRTT